MESAHGEGKRRRRSQGGVSLKKARKGQALDRQIGREKRLRET